MWAWRWAAAFRGMALADSALGRLMGQAVALTVTLACAVLVALGSWLLCSVQVAVVDVASGEETNGSQVGESATTPVE